MSTISKARRAMYRSASTLGDLEAVASGDPKRIIGRLWRKQLWRWLGRISRGLS